MKKIFCLTLFFIIFSGFSYAMQADSLHSLRGDMALLSDSISKNWLTRNWYYDQRLFGGSHPWFSYGAKVSEQKSRGTHKGFDYAPYHFTAGYDHSFGNLSLGALFMAHQGNFSGTERIEMKGKGFGLFGSYSPRPWYIAASIYSDLTDNKIEGSSRYCAQGTGLRAEYGYEFRPVQGVKLTPYAGAAYVFLKNGSWQASGRSYREADWTYTEGLLGFKSSYSVKTVWGQLIGKTGAAYSYLFGETAPASYWTESGTLHKAGNINKSREAVLIDAGIELKEFYATLTLHFDYRGEYRPSYRDHRISASIHLRF